MRRHSVNYAIALCVMGLAAAASLHLDRPRRIPPDTPSVHEFPEEIQGWTSEPIDIEERTLEILGTNDVVERRYRKPGTDLYVNLLLIFAVNHREAFHPPQYCMSGVGFTLVTDEVRTIDVPGWGKQDVNYLIFSVPVQHGSAQKYRIMMANLYAWRKNITADYHRQQFNIMLDGLVGRSGSGAMIRFTTPVVTTDEAAWDLIQEFARIVIPMLPDYLPGI